MKGSSKMFKIRIETTRKLNPKDDEDESASEALETIYHFTEDKVIFKFGDIEFRAFLNGDISDSWSDILDLMEGLKRKPKALDIQFPSQSFWHYWKFIEVKADEWEIEAFWSMDSQKKIVVKKDIVQAEFQRLVDRVESDLKCQGYDLFEFREYQNIKKNDTDKVLAWRAGYNYYKHSLQKAFYVQFLFGCCKILQAVIFAEGWDFLLSNYGLKGLFEIDENSDWLDTDSEELWLEDILYQGLMSGFNLQSRSYGVYQEKSETFKTIDGKIEVIDWEKFKAQSLG